MQQVFGPLQTFYEPYFFRSEAEFGCTRSFVKVILELAALKTTKSFTSG